MIDFNTAVMTRPAALFEAQAAHLPHAIAVVHGQRQVTYAELNERANRLAHHLLGLGVQPDEIYTVVPL